MNKFQCVYVEFIDKIIDYMNQIEKIPYVGKILSNILGSLVFILIIGFWSVIAFTIGFLAGWLIQFLSSFIGFSCACNLKFLFGSLFIVLFWLRAIL